MALPLVTNCTCDVYRAGNSPPTAPDVAGVACALTGDFQNARDNVPAAHHWTHIMLVALETDIRDDYSLGTMGASPDNVYVPDKNGTRFVVKFVERVGCELPNTHRRVYLDRAGPSWPTSEL